MGDIVHFPGAENLRIHTSKTKDTEQSQVQSEYVFGLVPVCIPYMRNNKYVTDSGFAVFVAEKGMQDVHLCDGFAVAAHFERYKAPVLGSLVRHARLPSRKWTKPVLVDADVESAFYTTHIESLIAQYNATVVLCTDDRINLFWWADYMTRQKKQDVFVRPLRFPDNVSMHMCQEIAMPEIYTMLALLG